jgi:hypothetical protein
MIGTPACPDVIGDDVLCTRPASEDRPACETLPVRSSMASGDGSHVIFAGACLPKVVGSFPRIRMKNVESLRLSSLSGSAGGRGSSGEEVCRSVIGSSQCRKAERGLTSTSLPCSLPSSPALTFPSSVCSVGCASKQRFRRSCNRTDAATGGRSREEMKKTFHRRCLGLILGDAEAREDRED